MKLWSQKSADVFCFGFQFTQGQTQGQTQARHIFRAQGSFSAEGGRGEALHTDKKKQSRDHKYNIRVALHVSALDLTRDNSLAHKNLGIFLLVSDILSPARWCRISFAR
jgi:hypothetical protein